MREIFIYTDGTNPKVKALIQLLEKEGLPVVVKPIHQASTKNQRHAVQ